MRKCSLYGYFVRLRKELLTLLTITHWPRGSQADGIGILCHTPLLLPLTNFENKMVTSLEGLLAQSIVFGHRGECSFFSQAVKLAAMFTDDDDELLLQIVHFYGPEVMNCCQLSEDCIRCELLDLVPRPFKDCGSYKITPLQLGGVQLGSLHDAVLSRSWCRPEWYRC